jgi:glyoxylase-like metal-dependent hydrolase (beta-lactamase superfamily II)
MLRYANTVKTGEIMIQVYGSRIAVLSFLLAVAILVGDPAYAQPARPQNPPDISGEWNLQSDEDPGALGALGQPPLGDYLGIPFNEAGRMRAETSAESLWGTPEYQCRPHSAPHQWRGLGGARILKEQDPLTREIKAYHVQFMRSLDWPIYMDGRPHPPAYAPHTWSGFSTGEWIGNTLKVTTTHLKDGYIRRGGPQTTDAYTMTDYITRHGDVLMIITVIDDPIYLDEPFVQSTTYVYDTTGVTATETCNSSAFAENGGTDRHHVPHFLPGQNTALTEWLKTEDWVPVEPTKGGVKTVYPEYRATFAGSASVASLRVPASKSAVAPDKKIADQSPRDGQVHILPVQENVYMLVADGTNITASIGPQGVLLVNTGSAQMTEKLQAAVNQLASAVAAAAATNKCAGPNCPGIEFGWSSPFINTIISSPTPPKPLRYIINTSDVPEHIGGNDKFATSGFFPRGGGLGAATGVGRTASVVAHENVLNRMSASAGKPGAIPERAWPTDTFFDELFKLPEYFNGEAVIVYSEPAANTDGDSIVFFRHSEVISAGNIFSTVSYPMIDLQKGGSLQGVIKGLNHILDLAVAEYRSQGGTWIIPSHGRLSDTADVASYRNMLVMIRDRIQDLINKGMTLEQVKAARPTLDFDGRYGSKTGSWTTDMFIEAAYRSLKSTK